MQNKGERQICFLYYMVAFLTLDWDHWPFPWKFSQGWHLCQPVTLTYQPPLPQFQPVSPMTFSGYQLALFPPYRESLGEAGPVPRGVTLPWSQENIQEMTILLSLLSDT